MKLPKSKIGLMLSFLYLVGSIFLILSQGLFGESFIALLLGFPWSFLIVLGGVNTIVSDSSPLFSLFLYAWVLVPIIVNVILLYWVGFVLEKIFSKKSEKADNKNLDFPS